MKATINNPFVLLIHWRNPLIVSAGAEKYIQIQIETLKLNSIDSIVIFPVRKQFGISLFGWGLIVNKQFIGVYDEAGIIATIQNALNKQICKGVFVHHLLWSDLDSLKRILSFSSEIIFYVHDFYSCCEQQNLLKNDECYCGSGAIVADKCQDCRYYSQGMENKRNTKAFLDSFKKLTVIAPSQIAADIWAEGYPEYRDSIRIMEHLKVKCQQDKHQSKIQLQTQALTGQGKCKKLNVAFVGNGTKSKGWQLWIEALKALPPNTMEKYSFYHFGDVKETYPFITDVRVSVAEDGADAMVKALNEHDIDVALLLSIVPETYSYTFFEAIENNCFIVTTDASGNIRNMVNTYENGMVIPADAGSLVELLNDTDLLQEKVSEQRPIKVSIEYNSDYLLLLKDIEQRNYLYKPKSMFGPVFTAAVDLLYKVRYKGRLQSYSDDK